MSPELTVVYKARTEPLAHALANLLNAEGIQAFVANQGGILPGMSGVNWLAPSVSVPSDQVTKAMKIVDEFEAQTMRDIAAVRYEDEVDNGSVQPNEDQTLDGHIWPTCPECSAKRPAQCPYCQHSGDDFQPAHGIDRATEFVVVCPLCDEPFAPAFFRLCHQCNHDFGEGKLALARSSSDEPADLNWRVFLVCGITLLIVGATFAYFYLLLARP